MPESRIKTLRELRKRAKMTQASLAELVGVKQQTVEKWENGRMEPGIGNLCRLAEVFSVTVDYLLGRVSDPNFIMGLSIEEANLIDNYRAVDDGKKQTLLGFSVFLKATPPTGGNINIQRSNHNAFMSIGDGNQNTLNERGTS